MMRSTVVRGAAAAMCAGIAFLAPIAAGQGEPSARLPRGLADYLSRHVKLTEAEQTRLVQSQAVTKLLDVPDPSREVSVFGAVWVAAPASRYVAAVRNIESFEKGDNFIVTKRISDPPRLEDFARLRLPPEDFEDLKTCKVGSCELKFGEDALKRLKSEVDWSKPTAAADVDAAVRRFSLEYVNGYLAEGNARLAVYRDAKRPTFIAKEFASMVESMPALTNYLPALKRYLLEFPSATLPNAESFLYWQEAQFGLKPTIRINHLTIVSEPDRVDIVSKMLYASHYFWTALELRVLIPDPPRGPGFWFVSVNQSRSDGLSGFVGTMIRGKVRGEAEKGMLAGLHATRAALEQP